MGASKTSDYIEIQIKMPNHSQETQASFRAPNEDLKDIDVLCTFKIKTESWKTSGHIQIQINILNSSQEPPSSSKALNEDLKDIDVLCTLKIKIESQNLDHRFNKDQWPYLDQDQDTKPSQEPPVSSKAPNEDLKDTDVLCNFKIKIESQN